MIIIGCDFHTRYQAGGRVLIPKTTLRAASLWFSGCGFFPDFIIITETALSWARFLLLWR